jgi:hypothetical protein
LAGSRRQALFSRLRCAVRTSLAMAISLWNGKKPIFHRIETDQ